MIDLQLADLVHRNLMEVNSWSGEAPGGALRRAGGEQFVASPSTLPFLNGAMRERSSGNAADMLHRAEQFFFERGRGFVVYCWPGDPELEAAASAAGMVAVMERYPEMVCRRKLAELQVDVRPVEDLGDAAAYWAICDAAYPSLGFPEGLFSATYSPEQLLQSERVWACLAHDDGRSVACASLWMAGGVGMVGWVAARPEARRRGFAAACAVRVTNRALDLGAEIVSLQASHMGEPVYRRLGYEELFAYRLLGAGSE